MAALDDFEIQGDLLKFNILHEDWGDGELPTFYKHVTAHVGWNEMRCSTAVDHQPPPPARPRPPGFGPRLLTHRPIAIESTAEPLAGMAPTEHFVTSVAQRARRAPQDQPELLRAALRFARVPQ